MVAGRPRLRWIGPASSVAVGVFCITFFFGCPFSHSLPGKRVLKNGSFDTLSRPWFSLPVLAVDVSR